MFCIAIPINGDSSSPKWSERATSSPEPPAETAQTHSLAGSICATNTSLFSPLESLSDSWSTPKVNVEVYVPVTIMLSLESMIRVSINSQPPPPALFTLLHIPFDVIVAWNISLQPFDVALMKPKVAVPSN